MGHLWVLLLVKTIHVFSLGIAIGMTVALFVIFARGRTDHRLALMLQRINLISLGVAIVSGFVVLIWANWDFASDLWFQIKTGFLLLLFVNALTYAWISERKLQQGTDKIRYALLAQIVFYAGAVAMSVFRIR